MRGRRRAQFACERKLAVVVEVVLVAEEDHLVLEQRVVDRRDGRGVEVAAESDAVDAGADVGAELHHVEEFESRLHSVSDGCAVNGLAGRDPKLRPR